MTSTDNAVRLAATENAHWCDLVSRSQGVPTRLDEAVWSGERRTPELYPDAVTLSPGVSTNAILDRIDTGVGSSVKDSFGDLDLRPEGYEVLYTSQWIYLEPTPCRLDGSWSPVRTHDQLVEWAAVRGLDILPFALLENQDVVILQRRDEHGIVEGAVAHRVGSVVGVSNVFTQADLGTTWTGLVPAISAWFGGVPIVGWERKSGLEAAVAAGFSTVGPVRVWSKR